MNSAAQSTFIITREDRAEDPKTIVSSGLRIGRLSDSDIWLNHPAASRLHAGINQIEGYFYLINLSASSATALNGRVIPFNEAEALTDGDELQIGPFFVRVEQTKETLRITVVHQFALLVGERKPQHKVEGYQKQLTAQSRIARSSAVANALKLMWDERTREKAARPSPLHPRTPPRLGKARFNWTSTRDLVRPWPFAILIWSFLIIGLLSTVAAFTHRIAFAPEPISAPHMRQTPTLIPAIAKQASGGSCTSCHALGVSAANRKKMNANCAGCHQSEGFAATIIPAHRDAGITCTTCHAEHRGKNFRPVDTAFESCTKCHNNDNKHLYNGKGVHTPHGGAYGYPVVNGVWVWKGLDSEELEAKPEIAGLLKNNRVNASDPQRSRNAQFHMIHLHRVRVVSGVTGVEEVDAVNQVMSCSSCHKTGYTGANVDRTYPRTTCAQCHNTQIFEGASASTTSKTPSCTSCHVQHIKDTHWASSLRIAQTEVPASSETAK